MVALLIVDVVQWGNISPLLSISANQNRTAGRFFSCGNGGTVRQTGAGSVCWAEEAAHKNELTLQHIFEVRSWRLRYGWVGENVVRWVRRYGRKKQTQFAFRMCNPCFFGRFLEAFGSLSPASEISSNSIHSLPIM